MAGETETKSEDIETHRERVEFAEILGQLLTNWAADERVVTGGQFLPQLKVALAAWGVTSFFKTDWRRIFLPGLSPVLEAQHRPEATKTKETQTIWLESGSEDNADK
ncbi:unnamed protein product [Calypogeia fissa]